ncbi:MAG: hypothetical protein ABIJ16_03730 [Bacteroidota bacterium]
MKGYLVYGILLVFSVILVYACKKPVKYPETPSIEFTSFEQKDTIDNPDLQNEVLMGILKFSFIDGDGDLGLSQEDTLAPYDTSSVYHYNLYIDMYEMKDGVWEPVDLVVPLAYRTPRVVATGQNKTLKGWIITRLFYNYPVKYDTVRYDFFIYDRALNKSNAATSGPIILGN